MWGLSLVAASGGHSSSWCAGLSLSRPLSLRSTGSRRAGSVVVPHGPSCSAACGIFPDQGLNLCPLHWQADSQPLRHQGSPRLQFKPLVLLVLRLSDLDWVTPLAFLDHHLANGRLWDFSAFTVRWANSSSSIYVPLTGSVSSENPKWYTMLLPTGYQKHHHCSPLPRHLFMTNKNVSRHSKMSPGGGETPPVENHWSRWKHPELVELDV